VKLSTIAAALLIASIVFGLVAGFLISQGNLLFDQRSSEQDCNAIGGCG
jgi:hypothetical protein